MWIAVLRQQKDIVFVFDATIYSLVQLLKMGEGEGADTLPQDAIYQFDRWDEKIQPLTDKELDELLQEMKNNENDGSDAENVNTTGREQPVQVQPVQLVQIQNEDAIAKNGDNIKDTQNQPQPAHEPA
eukprot:386582_1